MKKLVLRYFRTVTSTWSVGVIGMTDATGLRNMRSSIKELVNECINASLSVNPQFTGGATPSSASPRRDLMRQVHERAYKQQASILARLTARWDRRHAMRYAGSRT